MAEDQGELPDSMYARRSTPIARSAMNGSGAYVRLDHARITTRCAPTIPGANAGAPTASAGLPGDEAAAAAAGAGGTGAGGEGSGCGAGAAAGTGG